MPAKKKASKKPTTVSEYIADSDKEVRTKLKQIRSCILSAAPKAVESLKWGIPAVSYHRILVTYAGFQKHIGFYPTPSVMKAFAKELSKYKTGMGSVQFPLDKPLPLALVKKMTQYRVKESLEKDKKWM